MTRIETETYKTNKLIIEYLNVKETISYYDSYGKKTSVFKIELPYYKSKVYSSPNLSYDNFLLNAKYHKNWNWLMPVVEKIEEDGYEFNIYDKKCELVFGENYKIEDITFDEGSKLASTYKAAVSYIQWKNEVEKSLKENINNKK
jgi:hypothetical protein